MPRLRLLPFALSCSLLATVASTQDLEVGATAPALHIGKWLKGDPVESFAAGKVYVVEFWATWCGPCIASMPHLTELQARFKDQGVTILGVTCVDPDNSLAQAKKMVADKGDGMGYTVAWDDGQKTTDAYMKAARQDGIPTAFVIDGKGRLVFIGHPMFLDIPIGAVLAGTWDARKGTARIDAAMQQYAGLAEAIAADAEAATAKVDAFLKEYPMLAGNISDMQFHSLLLAGKFDKAYALAGTSVDQAIARKESDRLNEIAWNIVDPAAAVADRNLELALKAATKAVEFTKEKDANLLDTLARVWFWKQDFHKALEIQKKAVTVDGSDDPRKSLAEYEKRVGKDGGK